MLGGIGLSFPENHIKADSLSNTIKGKPVEVIEAGGKLLRPLLAEMKSTPLHQSYQITKTRLSNIVKEWQFSLTGKAKTEIEHFTNSAPDFIIKNIAEEYAAPPVSSIKRVPSFLADKFLMRLKHFTPDFIGWETKEEFVTFEMVEYSKDKIELKGLTFERKSENEMEIRLKLWKDDVVETEVFNMKRN